MFKGKTVVVTGGTGFIGQNLVQSLIDDDASVLLIVRGEPRIRSWMLPNVDLRVDTLFDVLKRECIKPDYIFHLAGFSGGIHYLLQHQADCLQTNLSIIANSFHRINEIPSLKGQVFLSSVCAYPQDYQVTTDRNNIVLSESLVTKYNPDSSYGWSKIMGEMLIKHYAVDHHVPGVSIRLFNTYGPHEHFDSPNAHVIPSIIKKVLDWPERQVDVLGDGNQVRSFLYIDDAIEAIKIAAANCPSGEVINVGSDQSYTIKDVVNKIIRISGKPITPTYTGHATGAVGRLPDLRKAELCLQWKPTTSLDDGLSFTYDWAKHHG